MAEPAPLCLDVVHPALLRGAVDFTVAQARSAPRFHEMDYPRSAPVQCLGVTIVYALHVSESAPQDRG